MTLTTICFTLASLIINGSNISVFSNFAHKFIIPNHKMFDLLSANLFAIAMKKIVVLIFCISTATFALSCGNKSNKADASSEAKVAENVAALTNAHNAKNSLDYQGKYHGVIPTAQREKTLNVYIMLQDSTYTKEASSTEESGEPIVTSGTYHWNEAGNTITLAGDEKPNQYFVGENMLIHLDIDGNKVEGELAGKYILKKELE